MSEAPREIVGSVVAGKYRIKRRIGAGGMGAVYEGEHVEIGKRVAIKVIEQTHAMSGELAARFKREARAASAVESEHIVHVFDVGTDETVGLYMVMELLAGEDLATRLDNAGGKLPPEEVVGLVVQAARGLAKAHAAGVVHRDLKPANLFLTTREDGSTCVKILDFGISKLTRKDEGQSTGSSALTREGSVMGTPMYMSPQQAQGMALDHRTDIWSLGAVLYEALTGVPPWPSRDTYEQMIIQIVTKTPTPIAEIAPSIPEALARVVERAMQHDLEARIADAASLAKELAEALRLPAPPTSARSTDATVVAAGPAGSGPLVSVRTATGEAPHPTGVGVVVAQAQSEQEPPRKRKSALMLIAVVGVIGAVVGVVVALTTKHGPSTPSTGSGLVATATGASAEPSASAAPSATTTTTLLPLATDSAPAASASSPPSHSSSAVAAAPGPHTTAVSTKPVHKPAGSPATATPATGATRPGQYGAAGVSTAY